MAKRETKESYKDIKQTQANATSDYDRMLTASTDRLASGKTSLDTNRDELAGQYRGIAAGDWNPKGPDLSRLSDVYGKASAFADTGGYSPEREASIMENVGGLKTIGKYGASDEAGAHRTRGLGVFDEFANTGGYSEGDKANIRSRGLRPISSYARNTQDELDRRTAVQGGYAPGFDSASRALRRDTARGIADMSVDTELGIKDRVNSNRLLGAQGASQSENLLTGNKMAGLRSAADVEQSLQESINNYKLQGMSLAQATAAAMADFEAQTEMAGIQIKGLGLQGLHGLYDTDAGMYENELNRGAGLLESKYGTQANLASIRNPLATQPGVGGNIVKGIGSAAGAAAGLFGGGGGNFWNPTGGTDAGQLIH